MMFAKLLLVFGVLTTAFTILFVSIMRTASIKYDFMPTSGTQVLGESTATIDYELPYPGKVTPDHFLWPVKALRDRVWYIVTTDKLRKTELLLLFADKRIGAARDLFEKGKADLGYSVLTKAEKYLEEAAKSEKENRSAGINTSEILLKINTSALKHYETMEGLMNSSPEDARPKIKEIEEYAIRVYESTRDSLYEKGLEPCINPFNWQ
jgi:hypothetical protein